MHPVKQRFVPWAFCMRKGPARAMLLVWEVISEGPTYLLAIRIYALILPPSARTLGLRRQRTLLPCAGLRRSSWLAGTATRLRGLLWPELRRRTPGHPPALVLLPDPSVSVLRHRLPILPDSGLLRLRRHRLSLGPATGLRRTLLLAAIRPSARGGAVKPLLPVPSPRLRDLHRYSRRLLRCPPPPSMFLRLETLLRWLGPPLKPLDVGRKETELVFGVSNVVQMIIFPRTARRFISVTFATITSTLCTVVLC